MKPTRAQLDRENRIVIWSSILAAVALAVLGCAGVLPS